MIKQSSILFTQTDENGNPVHRSSFIVHRFLRIRQIVFYLLIAVSFLSCGTKEKEVYLFTSFHEPADEGLRLLYSRDGYHWDSIPGVLLKPETGVQKVMRDPSIVRGPDGTFHLVWTCSWTGDYGFGYASSKDLIHWSEQKHIPVMAFDTTVVNVWAPELFYEDETQEFYMVWASTVPFKFEKGIEEERNNHRLYYTKTKDFIDFTPAALFYDPGFSSIDAVIVKRAPSDYVLVFKDNTRPERNIKVSFASHPEGPYSEASKSFTPTFTEGPSVTKAGDEWLIYFDAYRNKSYDAVSTKDFKTFTDIKTEITIPQGHKHGTIFKTTEAILQGLLNR
jgi:beta-xylosidase